MRIADKNTGIRFSITLLGILVVITPLCGFIFNCGCTWPWLGMADHCNIFDPLEKHPCPFCDRIVLSSLVLAFTTIAGLAFSQYGISRKLRTGRSILIDSIGGILVFGIFTAIAGSLF